MSFSATIKDALLQKKIKNHSAYMMLLCAATACAGMMTLRRGLGLGVKYISESLPTLKLIARAAEVCYDVEELIELHDTGRLNSAKNTELILYGKDAEKILYDAKLLTVDDRQPVLPQNEQDCIVYMRGAYLSCGTVSDPNKSFHLELTCRNRVAADMCMETAEKLALPFKYSQRKDFHIVYLKDAESISTFLSLIGADAAVLEFENVRIIRESRNYANRTRNCDLANIDRTNTAAMHQVEEIDFLLKNYSDELPDTLFEAAHMRLMHPEASLSELAELMNIGKSGVNHRLQRLLTIAKDLHEQENL